MYILITRIWDYIHILSYFLLNVSRYLGYVIDQEVRILHQKYYIEYVKIEMNSKLGCPKTVAFNSNFRRLDVFLKLGLC